MAVVSTLAVAVYGFIPRNRKVEPAGMSYEFSQVKDKLALGHSTHPVFKFLESSNSGSDLENLADESDMSWMDEDDSKYRKYMSKLDPANAKEQDHYRVLGVSKLRYKATTNQLKIAYRQKVLKYHPDKGNVTQKDEKNERTFSCIQKAYEQLGMCKDKRRAFDSVDPTFDEKIPDASEVNKQNFFKVLTPVFERNSRFSIIKPVPSLGDEKSDRGHVESFYEFWFNFKSWREFSYLDSEDKTKGEDKWERREIEKLNKAEREKRRKKDMKRISTLVDMAYQKDPRISAFKEEERRQKEEAKERKRLEREKKEMERKLQAEAEEREREAERQARLDEEKKANQLKQKKRKEMAAQRKKLRDVCTAAQYWTTEDRERLTMMEHIERICINAKFEELSDLCEKLSNVTTHSNAKELMINCAKSVPVSDCTNGTQKSGTNTSKEAPVRSADWTTAELQLLVKACGLFPVGTAERWRMVSEYVSNHAIIFGGKIRTEKEVIKQVKALNAVDSNSTPANQIKDNNSLLRESGATIVQVSKSNGTAVSKSNEASPDTSAAAVNGNGAANASDNTNKAPAMDVWSPEQQKQLETALRTVPATDAQRWEKIASAVDGKTKKECVKRYKHLAELVKQSKSK